MDVGGAFVAGKIGGAIGTAIGGVPGMIIGFAAGMAVGYLVDCFFKFEINGNTIAGHITNGIEWLIDYIF